jgi:excisionase family DNA binding protein
MTRKIELNMPLVTELCGYLTVDEYAQREGIHRETVKRRLRSGKLAGKKLSGSVWLIPFPQETAESCTGCRINPRGKDEVILDADGNTWHLSCAGELLAKFVRMREAQFVGQSKTNYQ